MMQMCHVLFAVAMSFLMMNPKSKKKQWVSFLNVLETLQRVCPGFPLQSQHVEALQSGYAKQKNRPFLERHMPLLFLFLSQCPTEPPSLRAHLATHFSQIPLYERTTTTMSRKKKK
jgi:hypothetical protein